MPRIRPKDAGLNGRRRKPVAPMAEVLVFENDQTATPISPATLEDPMEEAVRRMVEAAYT